jgi:hypothetical protein
MRCANVPVHLLRNVYTITFPKTWRDTLRCGTLGLPAGIKIDGARLFCLPLTDMRSQDYIPSLIDQNPCAHWRNPVDMMRHA